ncbi:SMP-30/gluconolactonase/LRE family protein [Algoriphagus sp. AK58]|uniref:SMP-30/gluconolactonase/LRE family protein n=1 Tax=Algoriphagus sp. AK58 TaxID=1406877 RepID=UPI00164F81D2|nr:SMP-30/gluconolactonase/LRE family protein [Algoriphagus sp. AK58]
MKIGISLGLVLLALGLFVLYTFWSTGFFRKIETYHEFGGIEQTIGLPGVEDMAISRTDSFMILSVDDRAKRRSGEKGLHGLYWMDLKDAPFTAHPIPLPSELVLYPHGISLIETGPKQYRLAVINHVEGKHSIEVFTIDQDTVRYSHSLRDPKLISPNDLVWVDADRFYYSNDHGSTSDLGIFAENYLGVAKANVGYYDGESFRIVAENMAYPNGLVLDQSGKNLLVASSRHFLIRVFEIQENGDLTFLEDIPTATGVDNLERDEEGGIWSGAHPDLMTFSAYAAGKKTTAPSEILKIHFSDQQLKQTTVWLDKGETMSASSVAIPFGEYLFLGNVMDSKMIVLRKGK